MHLYFTFLIYRNHNNTSFLVRNCSQTTFFHANHQLLGVKLVLGQIIILLSFREVHFKTFFSLYYYFDLYQQIISVFLSVLHSTQRHT